MRLKPHDRAPRTAEAYRSPARPDLAVARIAAECEGVVDLDELRACGLSRNAVSSRVKAGRLFPIHSRVYAVGHPPLSLTARFVAAAKACGRDAGLTHRASAAYWGIRDWTEGEIEVTVPGEVRRRHPGIRAEADGARWHDNALARAGDAERQALLEAAGETVLRVGWDEAVGRPTRFAKRLAVAGAPSEPTGGRSVGMGGAR